MINALLPILYMSLGSLFLFLGIVIGFYLAEYKRKQNKIGNETNALVDNANTGGKLPEFRGAPIISDTLKQPVIAPEKVLPKHTPKSQVMHYHTPMELQDETDKQAFEDQLKNMVVEERESGTFVL